MKKIILILTITFGLISNLYSAGSSSGSGSSGNGSGSSVDGSGSNNDAKPSKYEMAVKNIKKAKKFEKKDKLDKAEKHYKRAIKYLLEQNKISPSDPDTLNYLGFTHRKVGDYKNAEVYYLIGLELDPNHIGINEYLGELYVATDRIDLAKERLKVLSNCNCKEFSQLEGIIAGTKKSKY